MNTAVRLCTRTIETFPKHQQVTQSVIPLRQGYPLGLRHCYAHALLCYSRAAAISLCLSALGTLVHNACACTFTCCMHYDERVHAFKNAAWCAMCASMKVAMK
jgi:hypothetical protein